MRAHPAGKGTWRSSSSPCSWTWSSRSSPSWAWASCSPRLSLDARTVSRLAYYVFVPTFMFDVVSRADVPLGSALRMAGFAVGTHLLFAALGLLVARALRRPPEVAAGYVMVAVFGNVGNFGLALVRFRYGAEGIVPATIYFIVILVTAFATSVAAAAFVRGGGLSAVVSVFRRQAAELEPGHHVAEGGAPGHQAFGWNM